jgi:hypothetical protein
MVMTRFGYSKFHVSELWVLPWVESVIWLMVHAVFSVDSRSSVGGDTEYGVDHEPCHGSSSVAFSWWVVATTGTRRLSTSLELSMQGFSSELPNMGGLEASGGFFEWFDTNALRHQHFESSHEEGKPETVKSSEVGIG